jgi:hypothetical protein
MGVLVGFPIARLAGRAALIGAIIAGGLLAAGIAQAQAQTLGDATAAPPAPTRLTPSDGDGQPTLADRQRELIAASGGPAPVKYLVMAAPERPAVEERADDVADAAPGPADAGPADALNAAELAAEAPATPTASTSQPDSAQPH